MAPRAADRPAAQAFVDWLRAAASDPPAGARGARSGLPRKAPRTK
jgi:hypothetical protein